MNQKTPGEPPAASPPGPVPGPATTQLAIRFLVEWVALLVGCVDWSFGLVKDDGGFFGWIGSLVDGSWGLEAVHGFQDR